MSYAVPRPVTVAATAVSLCNGDKDRTSLNFHNVSTETKYLSTRRDVATSGNTQGKPLLANRSININERSGSDPTQEWYAIGTATGGAIIVTEERTQDRLNKTDRLLGDISGTLKTLVALFMKTR